MNRSENDDMKIAYLILAHNTPNHLQRLLNALSSPLAGFFVHIDRKADARAFSSLTCDNLHLTQERVSVFWGDFSQVEAILILLRTALADQNNFDRFVLLSGSDYPIRSSGYIEQFFRENRDKEFMSMVPIPCKAGGKPLSRLTAYKMRPAERPLSAITSSLEAALIKIGTLLVKRDYKVHLRDLVPYGGATWWALSRDACDYILNFVQGNPHVLNFFKNTVCPDESVFQTVLGNSPFKPNIVRNLTYADWSAGGRSPAYISEKHLAFFESLAFHTDGVYGNGEMLFARKFTDDSRKLVAMIDDKIRGRDGS